jgi:ABC-type multidrug transport system fused ATPase/permease subunit
VCAGIVFQYPAADEPTLRSLSLEINSGEYVALCGGSGGGKTTLLKLLGHAAPRGGLRGGTVTVDGVPADAYQETAMCLQNFEVLDGTVRDNISFGCEYDLDYDVHEAALQAEVAPVIDGLPEGYNTRIGRGSSVSLSGGQLARLGLARALCRRPKLLLLDEVSSSLDPQVSDLAYRIASHRLVAAATERSLTSASTSRICDFFLRARPKYVLPAMPVQPALDHETDKAVALTRRGRSLTRCARYLSDCR